MPIIDIPFQKVAIDLIGPLSPLSKRRNRWILTVVDCATRYPEAIALSSTTTEDVAEALLSIFSRVGFPKEVLSDNGPQFVSGVMREVARLMSIEQVHSSPYHPMANGLVERFNGTLKKMLVRMCAERPSDWDRYLEPLLFAYREAPQASTHFSPFELLYGRTVRGPMSILKELWSNEEAGEETRQTYQYVFDLRNRMEETCKIARENLEISQLRYKSHFDKKARMRSLEEGDQVLVMLPTNHNKLIMHWKGPYEVVKKVGLADYRIHIGDKDKIFHLNMLKKYLSRPEVFTGTAAILDPADDPSLEIEPLLTTPSETIQHVSMSPDLSSSHATRLRELMEEFSDIFTDQPGCTRLAEHAIQLNSNKPIRVKPYPIPFAKVSDIEREADMMLKLGVIEPSKSPYSCPLLLVKKPDGSNRPVVDFRQLNRYTKFDAEPMPCPDAIFAKLAKDAVFSKLDCTKGYWQIAMRECDKEKTAFSLPAGLFQFCRMPFGLVNAGAAYGRMMRKLLHGMTGVDNYIDGIIIYTQTMDGQVKVISEVFGRIRVAGLTIKPSKCFIAYSKVDFLGHTVGAGELATQADILSHS